MSNNKITRLEVIGDAGRAFVRRGLKSVDLSPQDEGRTLKVFITGDASTESKEVSGEEPYYPGQQYQRLLNVINESTPNPTITQMQDIIHVVHKDFPKEGTQDSGVEDNNFEIVLRQRVHDIVNGFTHPYTAILEILEAHKKSLTKQN